MNKRDRSVLLVGGIEQDEAVAYNLVLSPRCSFVQRGVLACR